jgi:hypothetical protein
MPLTGARKFAVLLMPWAFVALLACVYSVVFLPRLSSPTPWLIILCALLTMVFVSFCAAAVSFSRDVLTGHYRA